MENEETPLQAEQKQFTLTIDLEPDTVSKLKKLATLRDETWAELDAQLSATYNDLLRKLIGDIYKETLINELTAEGVTAIPQTKPVAEEIAPIVDEQTGNEVSHDVQEEDDGKSLAEQIEEKPPQPQQPQQAPPKPPAKQGGFFDEVGGPQLTTAAILKRDDKGEAILPDEVFAVQTSVPMAGEDGEDVEAFLEAPAPRRQSNEGYTDSVYNGERARGISRSFNPKKPRVRISDFNHGDSIE